MRASRPAAKGRATAAPPTLERRIARASLNSIRVRDRPAAHKKRRNDDATGAGDPHLVHRRPRAVPPNLPLDPARLTAQHVQFGLRLRQIRSKMVLDQYSLSF